MTDNAAMPSFSNPDPEIILPWLRANLKASGCVQPFAGGCSSIVGGKWLDRGDGFVEWLKADPLFRGLLASSMDTGRSTKINGGESLRYYLYRAAADAYADATPPVLAKGGLFKHVGLYAKDGSGFWNKHVNDPSIVPFEKFKSTGGMMLLHAKDGTPLRGEQQWPGVGEALRQAFTGQMTAAQKDVLLGTPFSELLGPLLSSVTVVEASVKRAKIGNEAEQAADAVPSSTRMNVIEDPNLVPPQPSALASATLETAVSPSGASLPPHVLVQHSVPPWLPKPSVVGKWTSPQGLVLSLNVTEDKVLFARTRDRKETKIGMVSIRDDYPVVQIGPGKVVGLDAAVQAAGDAYKQRVKEEKELALAHMRNQKESEEEALAWKRADQCAYNLLLGDAPPDIEKYTTATFSSCLDYLTSGCMYDSCNTEPPIVEVPQDDSANPVHRLPNLIDIDACLLHTSPTIKVKALRCIFQHPSTSQRFRVWISSLWAMCDVDLYKERTEHAIDHGKQFKLLNASRMDDGPRIPDWWKGALEEVTFPPLLVLDPKPSLLLLTGPPKDPFEEFVQNAKSFAELCTRSVNSLAEKKALQDAYYLSYGMYAAPNASMSLSSLRNKAEEFCEWTIYEDHPLHRKTEYFETTANFLQGVGLRLDDKKIVHGLGIATDPGHRLELMQNGHYPPKLGLPEVPPHSPFDFAGFVKHVQKDPNHSLKLTADGSCKIETLIQHYERYFNDVSMSRFRKEHSAWLQRHSRWDHGEVTEDPGPESPTPTMDELDDALLKRFKIYRSKFFEGNEEVEVVNGFAEHQEEQDPTDEEQDPTDEDPSDDEQDMSDIDN